MSNSPKEHSSSAFRTACAVRDISMSDGAIIRLRRHGNPDGTRLVLSHGNGLAIQGYAVFWERLCSDFDVILFDMRNHGVNPIHNEAQHHWDRFALDIGEIRDGIDREFGDKLAIGVFHSLSAVAGLIRVINNESGFDGLVLFDPPILTPADHPLCAAANKGIQALTERTLRRKSSFKSPADLAEQYATRAAFQGWVEGVAEDMATATLVFQEADQRWWLVCSREMEARIYATNDSAKFWHALLKPLAVPVKIIGADPFLPEQAAPALVCHELGEITPIDYCFIPDTSHFLQVEKPNACVEQVRVFVEHVVRTAAGASESVT